MWIIDACRSADSDLCVECVEYTRTRAWSGSGSSRWSTHSERSTPLIDSRQRAVLLRRRPARRSLVSSPSAAIIAVRWRDHGTAVANAYQASSQRKQMSGLIASTSSMTCSGL